MQYRFIIQHTDTHTHPPKKKKKKKQKRSKNPKGVGATGLTSHAKHPANLKIKLQRCVRLQLVEWVNISICCWMNAIQYLTSSFPGFMALMNQEGNLETFQKGLIIYTRLIIWPLNVKKIVAVKKKAWKFSLFNPDISDTGEHSSQFS